MPGRIDQPVVINELVVLALSIVVQSLRGDLANACHALVMQRQKGERSEASMVLVRLCPVAAEKGRRSDWRGTRVRFLMSAAAEGLKFRSETSCEVRTAASLGASA